MKKIGLIFITLTCVLAVMGTALTSCDLFPDSNDGSNDGETSGDPEPGTLTVNLTNAATANGHDLWAYVYAAGETDFNTASTVIATNYAQIVSGSATLVLEEDDGNWAPNGTEWTGQAGASYDVYIYTDVGGDNDPIGDIDAKQADPMPIIVEIDGNQIIEVDYFDMVEYTFGE